MSPSRRGGSLTRGWGLTMPRASAKCRRGRCSRPSFIRSPARSAAAMIVTIDGSAGSGKSSAAPGLAARLGFEVLDTGATYRAVALAVLRGDTPDPQAGQLDALLARIHIDMPNGRVLLNGEDVTQAIRTPEVSQAASRLAELPAVRRFLVTWQRQITAGRNGIFEGRGPGG